MAQGIHGVVRAAVVQILDRAKERTVEPVHQGAAQPETRAVCSLGVAMWQAVEYLCHDALCNGERAIAHVHGCCRKSGRHKLMQIGNDCEVQVSAPWHCTWPCQTGIRMTWAMGNIWEMVTSGL